jgi:hypothetical protein
MKELIERMSKQTFLVLVILLLLLLIMLLSACAPLGVAVGIDTNLPLYTTRITVLNTTPFSFYVLIDGEERGEVGPYGKWVSGIWSGSYYGVQIAIQIVDKKGFAYSDNVWIYSSYSYYSYTFTIRQDQDGRLWVERR